MQEWWKQVNGRPGLATGLWVVYYLAGSILIATDMGEVLVPAEIRIPLRWAAGAVLFVAVGLQGRPTLHQTPVYGPTDPPARFDEAWDPTHPLALGNAAPRHIAGQLLRGLTLLVLPSVLFLIPFFARAVGLGTVTVLNLKTLGIVILFFSTPPFGRVLLTLRSALLMRESRTVRFTVRSITVLICLAAVVGAIVGFMAIADAIAVEDQRALLPANLPSTLVPEPRVGLGASIVFGLSFPLVCIMGWGWLLREGRVKKVKRMRDADAPRRTRADVALTVAHLSDLHVTSSETQLTIEQTALRAREPIFTNPLLRDVFDEHDAVLAETDAIAITGDITDTGASDEWKQFFAMIDGRPWAPKLVIAPGNHDINVVSPRWAHAEPGPLRRARMLRFLMAIDRIQGDRSYCVVGGKPLLVRDYLLRLRAPLLHRATLPRGAFWHAGTLLRVSSIVEEVWRAVFPMLTYVGERSDVVFLILDSNAPSSTVVTNALGKITEDELVRANELLASAPTATAIALLHHHLRPPNPKFALGSELKNAFLAVEQPFRVSDRLADLQCRIALHGHTHIARKDTTHAMQILGAPSSTLGDSLHGSDDSEPRLHGPGFVQVKLAADGTVTRSIVGRS